MHLLIDAQALQTPGSRFRGIGRYSSNLLRAMSAARPHWRIEVVSNASLPPIHRDDSADRPILSFRPPLSQRGENLEINERYYADWLTARGADGVLILSHCECCDAVVPSFCGPRPPIFGIAYDLIPLLYPHHYLTEIGIARWYAHRFRQMLDSDVLLAISEATAGDVRALGGEATPPVVNIAGAVDPLFVPLPADELAARTAQLRERFDLRREFIIYVGALDYRKNLEGALRAFAALPFDQRRALDFVVVCRFTSAEQTVVDKMLQRSGIGTELKWIRSADDQDLRALYQMCRLFFFPTLYEGLGLPLLEALHCGAPVVTSNTSSLPEYAGSASWLGDPASPAEMARLLKEALAEPREARRSERELFARSFTWSKTAERACAAVEGRVKRGKQTMRRRRLAWIAPLTTEAKHMAEYAARLLPTLEQSFEIEFVTGCQTIAAPEALLRNYLILRPQEVAKRHAARPYDMFIYHLHVQEQMEYIFDLLSQFPGLIVRHDFPMDQLDCLNGLLLGVLDDSASPHAFLARLEETIRRYDDSDGVWRTLAAQCLAGSTAGVDTLIDSWARIRVAGQQRSELSRRQRQASPSAA